MKIPFSEHFPSRLSPEKRQVKARLEQIKNQKVGSSPEWLDSLKRAQQSNKDRANVAKDRTETPNPNAPQAEKPLNRGTPAEVAAKDALLNLPPEERLMQTENQALSDLERQRDAAAQANDVEEFRRLNNVIRRQKSPSIEE